LALAKILNFLLTVIAQSQAQAYIIVTLREEILCFKLHFLNTYENLLNRNISNPPFSLLTSQGEGYLSFTADDTAS